MQPVSLAGGAVNAAQTTARIPTFAVLPVTLYHAKEKAFADLPVLVSTAVANRLGEQLRQAGQPYGVLNPVYAHDDLKANGTDGLLRNMARDMVQAGQPAEQDLVYLADKLGNPSRQVKWLVFVHADFDPNQITRPPNWKDKTMATLFDKVPSQPTYLVRTTVQVFGAEADNASPLWQTTATTPIPLNAFGHFSKSVYNDNAVLFRTESDRIAQRLLRQMPLATIIPATSVQAVIVQPDAPQPAQLTPADRETIKRIINY